MDYIRLKAVGGMAEHCDSLSDIGCDHGILSKFLLESGKVKRLVACDVSEGSLNKAKKLLSSYTNVEYCFCDGVLAAAAERDTILISGLGGREIIRILSDCAAKTIIVQPQNFVSEVRRALLQRGYAIVSDFVISERGKFYDCIKAKLSNEVINSDTVGGFTEEQLQWGMFCRVKQPLLLLRLEFEKHKTESYKATEENLKRLKIITEVIEWQQ